MICCYWTAAAPGGRREAAVRAGREFLLELVNPTSRVHVFQLTGVERMALAANFNVDLRLSVTGVDHIAAGTSDGAVHRPQTPTLVHLFYLTLLSPHHRLDAGSKSHYLVCLSLEKL